MSKIKINDLNMICVLKNTLEKEVKKEIAESIVREELSLYEERIRKIILPLVNEISFKHIEKIKDLMCMRDELHIFLHMNNGNENNPVRKTIN